MYYKYDPVTCILYPSNYRPFYAIQSSTRTIGTTVDVLEKVYHEFASKLFGASFSAANITRNMLLGQHLSHLPKSRNLRPAGLQGDIIILAHPGEPYKQNYGRFGEIPVPRTVEH